MGWTETVPQSDDDWRVSWEEEIWKEAHVDSSTG